MSSSVDNRNILLIVSAENCGACKTFEEQGIFEAIKKQLESDGYVRIEHIKVKKIGDAVDSKYSQQINSWIRFYPTFILINGKDWNSNFSSIDQKSPNIEIFNARMTDGIVITNSGVQLQGPDKIPEWVKNNVTNNIKFKSISIISTNKKLPTISIDQKSIESDESEPVRYIPTCGSVKFLASSRK